MMNIRLKHIILFMLALSLAFPGACKNNKVTSPVSPTIPTGGMISELSGNVTLNNQAFENIDVYLSWGASQKTKTEAFGKYKFSNLLSGNYVITPSRLGYAFNPSNYEVNISKTNLDFSAEIATFGCNVGYVANNFTAKNQNGHYVSLNDFFGKVILLDISAPDCVYSQTEAEHLESIYTQYKDRGLQVITILEKGLDPSSWAKKYNLTFPVLDDSNMSIFELYDGWGMPLNIIVDRNCVIRYRVEGFEITQIKSIIDKYL